MPPQGNYAQQQQQPGKQATGLSQQSGPSQGQQQQMQLPTEPSGPNPAQSQRQSQS